MISVIVSTKKGLSWTFHRDHVGRTIGCEHEYVAVDNTDGRMGLCAAYNQGVGRSRGDILVFMHEDVFAVTGDWGRVVTAKFDADRSTGLIGVAGTQYLGAGNPFWPSAGRPFICGRVIHDSYDTGRTVITLFSQHRADTRVVAVDGLFFAIRRELFSTISFDEHIFDGFHFYDLDICMQVGRSHRLVVTTDILVKHFSGGNFRESWKIYAGRFTEKYRTVLPASCVNTAPRTLMAEPFESLEIGRLVDEKTAAMIRAVGREKPAPPAAPAPEVIAVTGMHRSGTSCVAGLLCRCGYSAGPDETLLNANTPQADNEKGHFENSRVVAVNEAALQTQQGAWYELPAQEKIDRIAPAIGRRIEDFARDFAGSLIKDPRLCLTLHIWQRYLPRLRAAVVCLRHPLGVARSLEKRNRFPAEKSLALWYAYNRRLLDSAKTVPAVFVDYDTLANRTVAVLQKLLERLGTVKSAAHIRESIAGFYDPGLDHNRAAGIPEGGLPAKVEALYEEIRRRCL